jgi:hypothetical protein
MKAHLVRRAEARAEQLAGMVLCQEVRGERGENAFAKGRVVQQEDVPTLMALPWEELHVIEPEPGELHEDEAGGRIAAAVAGEGVAVGRLAGGHWPLSATQRGILHVEIEQLRRVNSVEGACVYTLYDGQIVEPGEVVARAKITPFVLEASRVEAVEQIARETNGLVCVRPFQAMTVGAVVQETLGEKAMTRFKEALGTKVAWFGSRLLEPAFVPPSDTDIAGAIESLMKDGAEVIIMAGAKAMDPLDPTFLALRRLGVQLERYGVPAHPGSLFWLAHLNGSTPLLGMPTCGLFSQATVFDLVLPKVLAGERVGSAELAELGHGGLLTRDLSFRFPQYRPAKGRGEVE